MWDFFRTVIANALTRQPSRRRPEAPATDWLPPVLGPYDWQSGMMADRSAAWYFERD